MDILPSAPVAPKVTFDTIVDRLSEEYPVMDILPREAVAPAVMSSIIPDKSAAS